MADPATPKVEQIVSELVHEQINAYLDVVGVTLLVYEVIANLRIEIEYIWMWKWSSVTVLYLFQRYLPLIDTAIFSLHNYFGLDMSARRCLLERKAIAWSFLVGILLSETLLTLRVWAVWNKSIPVGIGLLVFLLAFLVGGFVALKQFLDSMILDSSTSYPDFSGCFAIAENTRLSVIWSLLMAFDTGTFVMILIPAIKAYRRGGRSELLQTIYRDGVLYYAVITLFSVINVVVTFTLPVDLIIVLAPVERVLHSVMTSRAILQIRQVAGSHSIYSISDDNSHWQMASYGTLSQTHEWYGSGTPTIVCPEPEHSSALAQEYKEENIADSK